MSRGAGESQPKRRSRAALVAGGILLSRLMGFVRERALAHYLGVGPYADVLRAAFRAPNLLQNLLGEGTLSAAFIPIYSRLLAEEKREEAGRFAGAVLGLLVVIVSAAVLGGLALAEPLVSLLTPGFADDAADIAAGDASVDRYPLAVSAVRIIFPMTGCLVLSAWALAILNSHRRFLLPYAAPVLWSTSIIAALFVATRSLAPEAGAAEVGETLLRAACFGALIGGVLQLLVQLPLVLRLVRGLRPALSLAVPGVRDALRAAAPVIAGRGVVQIAGYLDLFLASLLTAGAVAALSPSLYLYILPVSLFGMSVAAAELPELSRTEAAGRLVERVRPALAQTAYFTAPTMVGYLAFGFLVVGLLLRTGRFGLEENWLVYAALAGYSLGLLATAWSRLVQNTFYALRDTRTPAKIAALRVMTAAAVGVPLMFWLDRFPVSRLAPLADGGALYLGVVGLSLGSAVGAWVELFALRRALAGKLPSLTWPWRRALGMAASALLAALLAAILWWLLPPAGVVLQAIAVLPVYAIAYLGLTRLLGFSEAAAWMGRFKR